MEIVVRIYGTDGQSRQLQVHPEAQISIRPGDRIELVNVDSQQVVISAEGSDAVVHVQGWGQFLLLDYQALLSTSMPPSIDFSTQAQDGGDSADLDLTADFSGTDSADSPVPGEPGDDSPAERTETGFDDDGAITPAGLQDLHIDLSGGTPLPTLSGSAGARPSFSRHSLPEASAGQHDFAAPAVHGATDADSEPAGHSIATIAAILNDAPDASDGAYAITEDTPLSGRIQALDPNNDALAYTVTTSPEHGTVTMHPDGEFSYDPNENWHGEDSFQVTVDDGRGGTDSATIVVKVSSEADVPSLTVSGAAGAEDTAIALDVSAALSDTDGSEALSVTISGVPEGASLSAGTDNGDGTWTLSPGQLAGLTIAPPADSNADFDLSVTATASEGDGDSVTTAAQTIHVSVAGVADVPSLTVSGAAGAEDTAIALDVSAALSDTDGSETLSVTISGVPAGAALSAGTDNGDGTWSLSQDQLAGLSVTPPADSDQDFSLSVTAISTESDGSTASTTALVDVAVTAVVDAPVLTVAAEASGAEVTFIPVAFNNPDLLATECDILVSGVPEGASLSAGTDNGDGSWTVTSSQLAGLAFLPPANSSGTISLTATELSESGDNDSLANSQAIARSAFGIAENAELDDDSLPSVRIEGTVNEAGDNDFYAIELQEGETVFLDVDHAWGGEANFDSYLELYNPAQTWIAGNDDSNNDTGSYTVDSYLHYTVPAGGAGTYYVNVRALWSGQTDGDYVLNVSIDPTDSSTGLGEVPDSFVDADNPITETVDVAVDTGIALDIDAPQLSDGDGSESLSLITISGVPQGATLSAGTDNGDGSWSLSAEQLEGLTISPAPHDAADFTLTVSVTSTEAENGASATTTQTIDVSVDAVATVPSLTVAAAAGDEDAAIALDIDAALLDTDGSETLSITISGVPQGASLSAGTDNGDGSWTLSAEQLAGLTITPPADSHADFTLGVTACGDEAGSGSATTSATLDVRVNPVPDISVSDLSVNEHDGLATFTVTLDDASANTVTVRYAAADGSASAGQDYTAASGTLSFAPGETSKTITVAIVDDESLETPETFTVTLSDPVNGNIAVSTAQGTILDNDGDDNLVGGAEDDILIGGGGADVLEGNDGNDLLRGGSGDDSLSGGEGIDTADYSDASAAVTADLGLGTTSGGSGNDTLSGIENLTGSAYGDALTGDGNSNLLSGGGGSDTLAGGGGADELHGGTGDDTLVYDAADTRIDGGDGNDTLRLDGSGVTLDLTSVDDAVITGIEHIDLTGNGDNTLKMGAADVKALSETSDTVLVTGDAGDELQLDGSWSLEGSEEVDGVTFDRYELDGAVVLVAQTVATVLIVEGTDAADTITGSAGTELIDGGAGPDVLDGGAGSDTLSGGTGNDTLIYDAADLAIDGGAGEQDTLRIDGTGQHLDLTGAAGDAIAGIERIDITGNGDNTLTLGRQDTLDLSDTSDTVAVIGDAGDTVNLDGIWTMAGTQPVDGLIYNKYTSGEATVLVHPDVTVNLHLEGTPGDDALTAGSGSDVIDGLAGNDVLDGAGGADTLRGGDGADTLIYDGADTLVDGGTGSDTLRIEGHGQVVDLLETDDGVFTNIETVDLTGDGANTLILGAADVAAINAAGVLTVTGAAGDTVNLNGSWAAGADEVVDGVTYHVYTLDGATLRVADGIAVGAVITGTPGDDDLTGTAGNDVIRGEAGADILDGGAAADVLRGGAGNDTLVFDAADAVIDGGADTDTVAADGNVDLTQLPDDQLANIEIFDITGSGDNQLVLARDDVAAMTDAGNALTVAGNAGDSLVLKGGWDAAGSETVAGVDYTLFEKDGVQVRVESEVAVSVQIDGTAAKDTLTGGTAAEVLNGEAANDTLNGGGGADTLHGGSGDDVLVYDSADALIDGGAGSDTLRLTGSGQMLDLDALPGGQVTGIEQIDLTGSGDNAVIVSPEAVGTVFDGRLIVQGNVGDSVTFRGDWEARGTEQVNGTTYDVYISGENTVLVALDVALGQVVVGTDEAENLSGGGGADILEGLDGDDTLDGGLGVDELRGGAGNDTLVYDPADIAISGQTDNDTLQVNADNTIIDLPGLAAGKITGIEAVDLLGSDASRLILGASDVLALSDTGTLTIDGDDLDIVDLDGDWSGPVAHTVDGVDYSQYTLDGATVLIHPDVSIGYVYHGTASGETMSGPAGSHVLRGEGGDDLLDGGAGNHVLDGGAGDDILVYDAADGRFDGGTGSDTLRVAGGGEAIDLTVDGGGRIRGIERIDLTGNGANDLTLDRNAVVNASDSDSLIVDGDADDTVTLEGGWVSAGTVEIDGLGYQQFTLKEATVTVSGEATIQVINELGGITTFGTDGDDSLTVTPAGAVVALDGDDTIRLDNTNFTQIDGGGGHDVVDISNGGTTLNTTLLPDAALTDIEEIDMAAYPYNSNHLVLTEDSVIAATDEDNVLIVTGDDRDTLELQGDWSAGDDVLLDGTLYHTAVSESGAATVHYSDGPSIEYTDPVPQVSVFGMADDAGLRLVNAGIDEYAGYSVTGVGDVDGDGYDDILVGAYGTNYNQGAAVLVFGRDTGFGEIDLDNPGSGGITISGGGALYQTGYRVNGVGDVNGDGLDDFVISGNSSNSYLFLGKSAGWQDIDLSAADHGGIKISNAYKIVRTGDINGDGFDDLLVGGNHNRAYDTGQDDQGAAYVVWGKADGWADMNVEALGDQGFRMLGDQWDWAGYSVAGAGDLNGDGYQDFIVGAPRSTDYDYSSYPYAPVTDDQDGSAYVVLGKEDGWSDFNLSGGEALVIDGVAAGDLRAGLSVAQVGDVNADGYDDMVVKDSDAAYLLFGGQDFAGLTLGDDLGGRGVRISGGAGDNDLGEVQALGDINSDGYDDFLVAAPDSDDGDYNSGAVFVVYGKAEGWENFSIDQIGDDGLEITGGFPYERFGTGVYSAGDIDGDGVPDILIGSPFNHQDGYQSGSAFVLRGGDYSGAIIQVGSNGNDLVLGNYGADKLAGQQGNDTLIGLGGADILRGGQGYDIIGVSDLEFVLVDGGTGTDTLRLDGKDIALDFSGYAGSKLRSFEQIDLGSGERNTGNSISANYDEVLDLLGRQQSGYMASELNIFGDGSDTVNLQGPWASIGTITLWYDGAAHTMDRLVLEGIEVRVEQGIQFNLDGWDLPYPGATLDLNDLPEGVRFEQAFSGNYNATDIAGDINGDGFADLVVGYRYHDMYQESAHNYTVADGGAWLLYGGADGFAAPLDLAAELGEAGVVYQGGASMNEQAGNWVSAIGDVDGDGLQDFMVGAQQFSETVAWKTYSGGGYWDYSLEGQAYLFNGAASLAGGKLAEQADAIFTGGSSDSCVGAAIAGAGDVNGDGYDDFLINQGVWSGSGSWLVFGNPAGWSRTLNAAANGSDLSALDDAAAVLISTGDRAADTQIAAAGDMNGDGYDDFIIGAQYQDNGIDYYHGGAYLVFGRAEGDWSDLSLANGGHVDDNAVWLKGTVPRTMTGDNVECIGDLNGDGYDDVLISSFDWSGHHDWRADGAAYVVFGKADGWGTELDLENLGDAGFKLTGEADYERLASTMAGLGDVNGDGYDDFILTAPGNVEGGVSYLIFGKADGWSDIDMAHMGEHGIELVGNYSDARPAGGGDIDGDGYDDILLGDRILYGTDFLNTAEHVSDAAGGSLTGTAGSDNLIGNSGSDILVGGGGADVLYGGAGDDVLTAADSGFFRIDGGSGSDTLAIDGDLDLTGIANNKLDGIERIDITGTADHTLTLDLADVLDISDTSNQLFVEGNAGDAVVLHGGAWSDGGVVDGYHSYSSGAATLLVDTEIASITIVP